MESQEIRIQSVAFVCGVVLCVLVSAYFAASYLLAPEQPYETGPAEKINPNNAGVASLARLPGIGPMRAEAIVAYRENCSNSPAFQNCNDLQEVSGIGPKTVENISEWLTFE